MPCMDACILLHDIKLVLLLEVMLSNVCTKKYIAIAIN